MKTTQPWELPIIFKDLLFFSFFLVWFSHTLLKVRGALIATEAIIVTGQQSLLPTRTHKKQVV